MAAMDVRVLLQTEVSVRLDLTYMASWNGMGGFLCPKALLGISDILSTNYTGGSFT